MLCHWIEKNQGFQWIYQILMHHHYVQRYRRLSNPGAHHSSLSLKQHRIHPDFMNIIQFHYHNTIKDKVKDIFREILDMVEVIIFSYCCKYINTWLN